MRASSRRLAMLAIEEKKGDSFTATGTPTASFTEREIATTRSSMVSPVSSRSVAR